MGSLTVKLEQQDHENNCALRKCNCCSNNNHSRNLESYPQFRGHFCCRSHNLGKIKTRNMLEPPQILLHSTSLDIQEEDHQTVQLIKDKRSNSCFSESSEPGSLKNGAEQGRRPSRAFLIKQRDSGEETLVTLTPVGGRQNVPTIVGPLFSKGSMSSIESRSNDLRHEVSQEALEAQRVEKLVRHLRRQVTNGSCDEETSRLNDWKQEVNQRDVDRRKSAAATIGQDFLKTPDGKNSTSGRRGSALPRMYSQQGPERLELPMLSEGRMQRAYSQEGEAPIVLQPLTSPHGGDTNSGQSSRGSSVYPAVYPSTRRRCSQAVAAYAATGDLEAVAEILKGDKDNDPDEDDFVMPPEKERKKMVLLISCIRLTMTFMAAIMVGITLGLSHVIEEKVIHQRHGNSTVFDHPIIGFDDPQNGRNNKPLEKETNLSTQEQKGPVSSNSEISSSSSNSNSSNNQKSKQEEQTKLTQKVPH